MLWQRNTIVASVAIAVVSAACTGSPTVIRSTQPPTPTSSEPPLPPTSFPSPTGDVPSPSPEPSPSIASVHYASRCLASQLTLGWGGPVSEPTGQHSLSLTLTNSSKVGCHLYGYPGVSFVDSGGRILPFRYVWGGDQVVTSSKPGMVELAPGVAAYELVNKYRCDLGAQMSAAAIRLIPPDERIALQLSSMGYMSMDYCGPGDPGSSVYVSPVEPTFAAATAF